MVQMGLTPSEALRACNHPCSKQKLYYELNLYASNMAVTKQLKKATADTSPKVIEIEEDPSVVNSSVTMQSSMSGGSHTASGTVISTLLDGTSWWDKCLSRHGSIGPIDLTTSDPNEYVKLEPVSIDLSTSSADASASSSSNAKRKNSTIRVSSTFASKKRSKGIVFKKLENEAYTKAMEEAFVLVEELAASRLRGIKVNGH